MHFFPFLFGLMKSIKGPVVITVIKVLAADCLVQLINQSCVSSDGLGMHQCISSLHKTIKLCAGNDERRRNGFSSRVGWARCITQVNMPAHLIAYFVGNWLFNFTLVLNEWVSGRRELYSIMYSDLDAVPGIHRPR